MSDNISYEKDREIVRTLAKQVAEIAALPVQQKTLKEWKANNGLKPIRPMFTIEQFNWGEIKSDELNCVCEDRYMRWFEGEFRRLLYRWNHFRDDRVIFPEWKIGKYIDWVQSKGMDAKQKSISETSAHVTEEDLLQSEEDIENIRYSIFTVNEEKSKENFDRARELLDGILTVKQDGFTGYGHPWDEISLWHGVENSIVDIIDKPDFVHKFLERAFDTYYKEIDEFEKYGLIGVGNADIHCTGAYTDELPGYNGESEEELEKFRYSSKNTWACGAAQLFSMVSPEIHEEFEIEYQKKWFSRFGLGYYGCCEPLDKKIHIIRKLPNIRKISMSPWVNMETGAEAMNGGYVFSRKPNPAFFSSDSAWNPELIKKDLEDCAKINAKYGNPVEFILKDLSTLGGKPQRLGEWAEIAAEICGKV